MLRFFPRSNQAGYLQLPFQNVSQFQLDIAGFLAILGEGCVLANAQVAALSSITFLPRLLPAPQALMMPSRPSKLEALVGHTTGVQSGNHRDYINHVGNVLVDAESLPNFSVKCVQIHRKQNKGEVQATLLGPLWALAILGFVESVVLLALSVLNRDDAAVIATVCLSVLSTVIGVGNKWTLNLPKRKQPGMITPPGDVVIRYPNGNFLIVQCHEDVARELYFAPENINYLITRSWAYRLLSLIGTFLLMLGVICLSNASIFLQIGFAVAYMILNAAYWIVAALPSEMHWDMSCFEVIDQCFETNTARKNTDKGGTNDLIEYNHTFTQALWKAIVATKSVKWVKRSKAAPRTLAWDEWLRQAKRLAHTKSFRDEKIGNKVVKVWEVPSWDSQGALNELIKQHIDDSDTD